MGKYLDFIMEEQARENAQFSSSIYLASDSNPDETARQHKTARGLGVPPAVVAGDPETANWLALRNKIESDTKGAPVTHLMYTKEDFARLAADDSQSLGMIERAGRNIERAGRNVIATGGRVIGSALNVVPETLKTFEYITSGDNYSPGIIKALDWLATPGQNVIDYWGSFAPRDPKFLDDLVGGFGQVGTQIAVTKLAGPVVGTAAMFGLGQAEVSDRLEELRKEREISKRREGVARLLGGSFESVLESIAMSFHMSPPIKLAIRNPLIDFIVKGALHAPVEGATEFVQALASDIAVMSAAPDEKFDFKGALYEGLLGGIIGAFIGYGFGAGRYLRAIDRKKRLSDLSDEVKNSKLKERDPELFQDYTDAVVSHLASTSEGAVTDVYINVGAYHQAAKKGNYDAYEVAEAVPSIKKQLATAEETGGDIKIPFGEFIGKLSGTDVGAALQPHIRTAPEQLSFAEEQQAHELSGQYFQAHADQIAANINKSREFKKSGDEVQKIFRDQLKAAGKYSDEQNRVAASFLRSFYVTQASIEGSSPLEYYQKHPYKIVLEGNQAVETTKPTAERGALTGQEETRKTAQTEEMYWPETDEARYVFSEFLGDLETGETKTVTESEDGDLIARGSSYMRWFRDVSKKHGGLSAKEAGQIISKYLDGNKPLTDRQSKVFADIISAAQKDPRGHQYAKEMAAFEELGDYFSGKSNTLNQSSILTADEALRRDTEAWGKSVDSFIDGTISTRKSVTMLKQTPLVLQMLGAKNLPVNTTYGVLKKVLVDKHKLPPETVKQVPEAMADPVMVFKSATQSGDLVMMLELKDQHGATVIVPIALEAVTPEGYTVNLATSVYGKGDEKAGRPNNQWFINQIQDGNLLYQNKKKSRNWAAMVGLQLPPTHRSKSAIENTIRTEADLVKLKSENPTLYQSATMWKYPPTVDAQTAVKRAAANLTSETLGSMVEADTTGGEFSQGDGHM